jgi:hypothetical protein
VVKRRKKGCLLWRQNNPFLKEAYELEVGATAYFYIVYLYCYCTFDLKYLVGHRKNINNIPMRSKTTSLTEKKLICAQKFVRSSDICLVISGQKMTYHTYHSHSKFFKNYVTKPM